MEGASDVVVVKESECLFVGDLVDIEYSMMCMFFCILGLEVWDRG